MNWRKTSAWTLLLPVILMGFTSLHAQFLDPSTLTRYVDLLPQPPVRTPVGREGGFPVYDVHVVAATQKMHRDLPETPVFRFDNWSPGPSFVVPMNQGIKVRYYNDLPENHMFHVDTTIHIMAGMGWGQSSRFVSHLHGGDVESKYDGWCMDFLYPGEQTTYFYPNSQPGATLWYHDHSCGVTRLNAYAGIAGFYLITDPRELKLNMPSGPYELGIAVQDRMFYADGQLYYPDEWVPEFFGNVSLVNGKIWPRQEVDPRKYRIRLLNGCDDRFLSMKLFECDANGVVPPESVPGPAFWMVGTEQGLVNNTVKLNDPNDPNAPRMLIGPGDRRDLIIDFAGKEGKYFLMHNNASAPFDGTYPPDPENPLPELFLIHVSNNTVIDPYAIPMHPGNVDAPKPAQACTTRFIEMREMEDPITGDPMMVMLNGKGFMDPTEEFPHLNCTEIWNYVNTTVDEHPMHMHLVNFQILDKTPFDVPHYFDTKEIVFTGPAELPEAQEVGRRDMVNCPPGYVTRVMTSKFNRLGKYVYHCHILAHEENDMMRPYEVVYRGPNGGGGGMIADVTPLNAALGKSSPEPFRYHTSIALSLPVRQSTRLAIFDVSGREVKTLVSGELDAGVHNFSWDGTSRSGSRVAAGVYYYKLQSGNSVVDSKRITLLQ